MVQMLVAFQDHLQTALKQCGLAKPTVRGPLTLQQLSELAGTWALRRARLRGGREGETFWGRRPRQQLTLKACASRCRFLADS